MSQICDICLCIIDTMHKLLTGPVDMHFAVFNCTSVCSQVQRYSKVPRAQPGLRLRQKSWERLECRDRSICRPANDESPQSVVTHQMCLVLWTWRKLADETNAKNAPKICWKIVPTWGIQTALAIHIMQGQDYPYAKNEYKLVVAIYRTRMTILEQEMTADV